LNRILSSFDAGSVEAQRAPLDNLFQAAQIANTGFGNVYDTVLADRELLGQALASDVDLGLTGAESALNTRIAADRASELKANTDRRAALDADIFMQRFAAEQQEQEDIDAVLLQMAQLGITPQE
jgi:hypothetical protein